MNRDEFKRLLAAGPLILDGATGTELMKAGLPQGILPEEWMLSRPDAIKAVAAGYAAAGSAAVYTCSFGASRISLAKHGLGERVGELNKLAVTLAREAAGKGKLVFGSMGPVGELLEPYGDLPEEDARKAFDEQAAALVGAGADALVAESHMNLAEALLAVKAARGTGKIAVMATLSFEGKDKGFKTVMGDSPEKAAEVLLAAGADAVGVNCGRGGEDALEVVKRMHSAHPGVPLVAKPNAGLPVAAGGQLSYPTTPEQFAREGLALREAGAAVLGGCCGTTPEHIRALVRALGK